MPSFLTSPPNSPLIAPGSNNCSMESTAPTLAPLPYHCALRDYFKTREPELWEWFASAQAQTNYTETLRLELLKSTYRLDVEHHPDIFRLTNEAKQRLGLSVPVTIYQSQGGGSPNASLFFLPGEAHLVLHGSLLSLLTHEELKSTLGHELAHHVLWTIDGGEFFVLDRLIQEVACDPRADEPHAQS